MMVLVHLNIKLLEVSVRRMALLGVTLMILLFLWLYRSAISNSFLMGADFCQEAQERILKLQDLTRKDMFFMVKLLAPLEALKKVEVAQIIRNYIQMTLTIAIKI